MRNLIYIFILIASSNIYSQTDIEIDELFIKYEQEYLKMNSLGEIDNFELANKNFYSKFSNYKERYKFEKNKDKERWLNKNHKRTDFNSATEAIDAYNHLVSSKEAIDKMSNNIQEIRNELLKKYDVNLIWETLQTRIKSKR